MKEQESSLVSEPIRQIRIFKLETVLVSSGEFDFLFPQIGQR